MKNEATLARKTKGNWAAESAEAFAHKIAFDFIAQIERALEAKGLTRSAFASELGVTQGSVSQVLNNPQNLTLKTVGRYCQALGLKAAVLAYNDGDPANERGLVNSEVFLTCWTRTGCPRDFWDVQDIERTRASTNRVVYVVYVYSGQSAPAIPAERMYDLMGKWCESYQHSPCIDQTHTLVRRSEDKEANNAKR